jgi:FKBP-type peptidyl-prolyl cis-trans isomerase SlpA
MKSVVRADSLLTLHYRLALADDTELVSTFGGKPATLQLGSGELAPVLERCLIDLPVGERTVFLLEPEQAFGPHNPQLMQRFVRSELPDAGELREMALIEFKAPNGATYTGLLRELTEEGALVDFNHPLAGKAIRFEVEVIGIL